MEKENKSFQLSGGSTSSKKKFSVVLFIILLVVVIAVAFSGNDASEKVSTVGVGDDAILNSNSNKSDCSDIASIAFTEEAFDDLTKASVAGDSYGYAQVFAENRAVTVPNCTSVKVIETSTGARKVRLANQPEISGWVPYEWVAN